VQTCVIHLLRNSFKYASRKDWDKIAKQLRPVYTAPTVGAAEERFFPVQRSLGQEIPRDRPAVGERVGGVHTVPGVGRG
jgi:transposase-like protein